MDKIIQIIKSIISPEQNWSAFAMKIIGLVVVTVIAYIAFQQYTSLTADEDNQNIDNIWGNYKPSYFTNFTSSNENISYETSKVLVHIKIVPKIYNYYNVKEEHFTKKNLK